LIPARQLKNLNFSKRFQMSSNILEKIRASKLERLEQLKKELPFGKLLELNASKDKAEKRNFGESIKNKGRISLIAEIKKASPSAGIIRNEFNPGEIAQEYERAGADAVSVLTEEKYFKGSLDNLALVKTLTKSPVLMKDFIIDEYQLYQALEYGADCVLLIVKLLTEKAVMRFVKKAEELGLETLVEAHNQNEIEIAEGSGAKIIGINNRNLETFETDIKTTLGLAKIIPGKTIKVSESGIKNAEDIKKLYSEGIDAVLVGEILMRSGDIGLKMKELLSRA
jgi:indole-3-glycerol phosphate synthase